MNERQLSAEETQVLYDRITNDGIRPFQKVIEDKCGDYYCKHCLRRRLLMNERIQKLSEQAGEHAAANATGDWEVGLAYQDLFNKKFAELIVGHAIECVRDVLRDENSDLSYVAASQVQKRLREFFGVEE